MNITDEARKRYLERNKEEAKPTPGWPLKINSNYEKSPDQLSRGR